MPIPDVNHGNERPDRVDQSAHAEQSQGSHEATAGSHAGKGRQWLKTLHTARLSATW